MENDVIISIRKKLKQNENIALKLIIDENYFIDERTSLVTWDDANGLLYAYCPNQERDNNSKYPGSVHVTSYQNIVMIQAFYHKKHMKTLLDEAISNKLTNQKSADAILKDIYDASDIGMTHTAKQIENDLVYDERVNFKKTNEKSSEKDTEQGN